MITSMLRSGLRTIPHTEITRNLNSLTFSTKSFFPPYQKSIGSSSLKNCAIYDISKTCFSSQAQQEGVTHVHDITKISFLIFFGWCSGLALFNTVDSYTLPTQERNESKSLSPASKLPEPLPYPGPRKPDH
ncbi:MAG: hypothetical protein AAGG81_00805 [Chlamydiota bacterium]